MDALSQGLGMRKAWVIVRLEGASGKSFRFVDKIIQNPVGDPDGATMTFKAWSLHGLIFGASTSTVRYLRAGPYIIYLALTAVVTWQSRLYYGNYHQQQQAGEARKEKNREKKKKKKRRRGKVP